VAVAIIHIVPGTPVHLDTDCTHCGWADVWEVAAHTLSPHGVGTILSLQRCIRCGTNQ